MQASHSSRRLKTHLQGSQLQQAAQAVLLRIQQIEATHLQGSRAAVRDHTAQAARAAGAMGASATDAVSALAARAEATWRSKRALAAAAPSPLPAAQ